MITGAYGATERAGSSDPIPIFSAHCRRDSRSLRQSMWGGWTCPNCGTEVDKWGREVTPRHSRNLSGFRCVVRSSTGGRLSQGRCRKNSAADASSSASLTKTLWSIQGFYTLNSKNGPRLLRPTKDSIQKRASVVRSGLRGRSLVGTGFPARNRPRTSLVTAAALGRTNPR